MRGDLSLLMHLHGCFLSVWPIKYQILLTFNLFWNSWKIAPSPSLDKRMLSSPITPFHKVLSKSTTKHFLKLPYWLLKEVSFFMLKAMASKALVVYFYFSHVPKFVAVNIFSHPILLTRALKSTIKK